MDGSLLNIFLPVKNPSPRILAQAVCLYLGIDPERVFEPCRRATGSITEACRMLLRNMEPGAGADARVEEDGARDAPRHTRLLLLYISPPSYTLGIRGTDGAYIPIGKVDSMADLPADERTKLHKRAKALITESFGPTSLLTPEIVVEASFSHVEANPRTKAKKVLRNVAITRICWDESIESIATLESL